MSDINPATKVARIRELYAQRIEGKREMQALMVSLRNDDGWTQQQIADATGISQPTVHRWLKAADEGGIIQLNNRLSTVEHQDRSEQAIAKRVLATAPIEHVEHMIQQLPHERRKEVAQATGYIRPNKPNVSPEERERAERDAMKFTAPIANGLANMRAEALVINYLESAADELTKAMDIGVLSNDTVRDILTAHARFDAVLDMLCRLAGVERP